LECGAGEGWRRSVGPIVCEIRRKGILHTVKRRKAYWIGYILRRNCFLQYVIEGKIDEKRKVTGRRGKLGKQLLGDKEERGQ
jgi:hypothetical protein